MSSALSRARDRLAARKKALSAAKSAVKKAQAAVDATTRTVKRLTAKSKLSPAAPKFVSLDLSFTDKFGQLGPETFVTGHHSAGPTDKSFEDAKRLCRQYHVDHAAKGWGGIGYHFNIARDGTIIGLRPTLLKGAHVGMHNSNNVGVLFHGTTGDKPTPAQHRSYKWLLASAHTTAVPKRHRTDLDLRQAKRRGHNDWPGHESNACPGTHKPLILAGG